MLKQFIRTTAMLAIGIILPLVLVAAPAGAQSRDDVCTGVGAATGGAGCAAPANSTSVNTVIRAAINILSVVVGIAAVVMIIFGGYKFVTSDGDAGKVAGARQTIIYALVGLLVTALSQSLAIFVFRRAT